MATTLLSRVADRIYWAARYLERAEDTARIVRAHSEMLAYNTHLTQPTKRIVYITQQAES